MKLYALVEHIYDYCELSDVIVVSDNIERIKDWHSKNMSQTPLIDSDLYDRYFNRSQDHVIIEEIDFI